MQKTTRSLLVVGTLFLWLAGCDSFMSVDQRIARAEQKRGAGDDRGAIIDLQNALKSAPDNLKARILLAELSLHVGDAKGAEQELKRAAQSGAKLEQLAELTAQTKLALGESDDLIAQLDAGKLPMSEADQLTYRGLALLAKGQPEPASEAFTKAIDADAKAARAHLGRAQAFAAIGRTSDALDDLDAVLDINRTNANALSIRGSLLARTGQYKQALQAYQSAKENARGQLTPIEFNTLLAGIAETQLALGDLTAAHASQSELAARAPDAPLTLFLAARIAMSEQKYSEAVANAQKALTAAPEFLQAKLLLGAALLANGSSNQAIAELGDFVQKEPGNLEARKLLAQAYLRVQRPDLATQVLAPIQAAAQDPQLDALRGWASLQQGDQEQAISLLERSVASQPDNASLKLDLALAYISSGANDKAIDLLQSVPSQVGGARRDTLMLAAVNAAKGADAGRAEAARLVASNPKDTATLSAAAAFSLQQRDFTAARDYLNRALALDPKSLSTLLALARVEAASGDLQTARKTYEQALTVDANNVEARLSLARLSIAQGDAADGVRRLEELRKSDPKSIEARLMLAALYSQQKKPRDADAVIAEALATGNGDAKVSGAVAQLYLETGRFDEAAAKFRDAATQDPASASWMLGLARAQIALGNYSAARESAVKAQSIAKNPSAATAMLVGLDLREGKADAALAQVEQLRKSQPKDPAAAMLAGDLALNRHEFATAAQAFQQSYALRPTSAAAIKFYGASSQAKAPQATMLLEDWIKRQPRDTAARMLLGSALIERGEDARAIEQYEQIALEPQPNALALNNLAWLYFQHGDTRAQATAKRAYDAAPGNAAIADTYGWILLKNKQVAEALPVLERAASASKAPPEIRYHYAAALAEAGQRDRALQIVREITANDASFPEAADARRLLAQLQG